MHSILITNNRKSNELQTSNCVPSWTLKSLRTISSHKCCRNGISMWLVERLDSILICLKNWCTQRHYDHMVEEFPTSLIGKAV